MTIKPKLSPDEYKSARAVVDKADAYWQQVTGGKRNWISREEAEHPDYAAASNDLRGRVEQYEILTNPPERLVAYIGTLTHEERNRTNVASLRRYTVIVWTGEQIGTATQGAKWRVNSWIGSHMAQYYATIAGREYTGRGLGEGMCISLRETAASKRKRAVTTSA